MNSDIFICVGCGFKSDVVTEQLCGHVYCKKCISNSILNGKQICNLHSEQESEEQSMASNIQQEIDGITTLDEAICHYCQSVLDLSNAQDHYDNCDQRPVDCPKCKKKCLQGQMAIHIEKCEENKHQCPYLQLGCHYQGSPAQVENHQNDIKIHFQLMMNSVINLENKCALSDEKVGDGNLCKPNECCTHSKLMQEDYQKQFQKLSLEIDWYKQRVVQLELEQIKTAYQITEDNKKCQELIRKDLAAENKIIQEQLDNINKTLDKNCCDLNEWNNKFEKLEKSCATINRVMDDKHLEFRDRINDISRSFDMTKRDLSDKLQNFVALINMLEQKIDNENKAINTKYVNLKEQLDNLKILIGKQEDSRTIPAEDNKTLIIETGEEANYFVDKIETLRNEMYEGAKSLAQIKSLFLTEPPSVEQCCSEQHFEICKGKCQEKNVVINQLDKKTFINEPFTFCWKIENFSKLPNYVHSDSFYSSLFSGYKMRLCMNHRTRAVKPHLLFGLQIMKGENDEVLKWPIEYMAKFSLFNELKRIYCEIGTLESKLEKRKLCFMQPMIDENDALYLDLDLELDQLKNGYLVNDKVVLAVNGFIKCKK